MRFTLKQLSYFVAVGEAGSILKASENIHVSQPSISSTISHLEQTFGLQLFVRHHAQGMALTTAGREFLKEAKSLLNHAENLHGFIGELAGQVIGIVEVGCFNPLAPIITPSLCHGFVREHPNVDIRVRDAHQSELLQLLRQGTIDLALTYDLQLQRDIHFVPLASLPPYVLLSKDHPLARLREISLEQLVEEPMILLDLPLSCDYFMGLFSRHDLKPSIKARTRLADVQRGWVASGNGYSLANVRPANKFALDGNPLKYVRLSGKHLPLTLGIATLKTTSAKPAQVAFTRFCEATITAQHIPGMGLRFD